MTMRIAAIALMMTSLASGAAHAQAVGSVLCRNNMQRADVQIAAIEKRIHAAVRRADDAEICETWRISLEVRRQAAETYGRCRSEMAHETRYQEIGADTEDLRRRITQYCG